MEGASDFERVSDGVELKDIGCMLHNVQCSWMPKMKVWKQHWTPVDWSWVDRHTHVPQIGVLVVATGGYKWRGCFFSCLHTHIIDACKDAHTHYRCHQRCTHTEMDGLDVNRNPKAIPTFLYNVQCKKLCVTKTAVMVEYLLNMSILFPSFPEGSLIVIRLASCHIISHFLALGRDNLSYQISPSW